MVISCRDYLRIYARDRLWRYHSRIADGFVSPAATVQFLHYAAIPACTEKVIVFVIKYADGVPVCRIYSIRRDSISFLEYNAYLI